MSQLALLRTRRFGPLFWTQFFGAFNDNVLKNALVILITYKTTSVLGLPSSQMVAIAGGIFILPFFLFSATSGQLADKYEKTQLIRLIKLAEIGIMVLATVGFVFHLFGFLLLVLFLMGLHSTFFGPIKYSILPQHLSEDGELLTGNALVESGTFLAILIGTILGGLLVSWDPSGVIVSLCLLSVSATGYLVSRKIPEAPSASPELAVQWNPVPPTIEIYRYTLQNRPVFLSVLGISWFWLFGAAMLSLFPTYCQEWLGARESVVTLFLALFSIGIGLGSFLCGKISKGRLELGLVPFGSIGITLFTFDLWLVGRPAWASVAPGVIGIAELVSWPEGRRILFDLLMLSVTSGLFIVPLYTLMQERTEPSHRSRIIAGNNIGNALFMVAASLALMVMLACGMTVPQIFLVLALANGAASIAAYLVVPEFFWRFITWILAHTLYRLRVEGLANIPHEGAAVLVCNHVSFVDWLIVLGVVPRPVRFVMDFNYAPGFFGRWLQKNAKVIPIATLKEDARVLRTSFERVAEELRQGELVCVFPEGFLSADGEMRNFRRGIEKIIADTPVPVIPMALQGLWGSLFSRKGGRALLKRPRGIRSRIALVIGKPMDPRDASAERLRAEVLGLRGERR